MRMLLAPLTFCLVSVLVAPGCVGFRGPADLSQELSRSADVRLDREVGLSLSGPALWVAKRGAADADDAGISLDGVRRVQVGVYNVSGGSEPAAIDTPLPST